MTKEDVIDELMDERGVLSDRIDELEEGIREALAISLPKVVTLTNGEHKQVNKILQKALDSSPYDDSGVLRGDLVAALKLVLMFHSGKPFGQKARTGWYAITGEHDATTKVMCDHIRKVLND
jgi:hypothetical protein